ncbi:MAG TPA: GNAT family N-acetyltransferase [Chloroflexota bacterium]|nr:GNAT family N-acetyltransferase [Chloroflexota bacterium]HUM67504.1 GNAT family N-acetyltransferase [Chloroflexota bacterium]
MSIEKVTQLMDTQEVRLRPASASDYDFVYQLRRATMQKYVEAIWGWDEGAQRQRFAVSFNPSISQIIVVGDQDVGELALVEEDDVLYLKGIYILPTYQNRGVGTAVLHHLLAQARARRQPVTLQVFKMNPARQLYERLGFAVVGESEPYYLMKVELAEMR